MKNRRIRAIAARAGVSPSTVSRYFSGFSYISTNMKAKIEHALMEMNQEVQGDEVETITVGIGYVAKKEVLQFYSDIIEEIIIQFQQPEINIQIISIRLDEGDVEDVLSLYSELTILILIGSRTPEFVIDEVCKTGVPLILIDNHHLKAHSIGIDNEGGVEKAVHYLYALGHRKIALIGAGKNRYAQQSRYRGYVNAMRKLELEEIVAFSDEVRDFYEDGQALAKCLLEKGEPFTALISTGEMMTVGAVNHLKSCGIRIPDDVSVIGFGESKVSENYSPRITTVSLMSTQVAIFTSNLSTMIIEKYIHEPVRILMLPEIVKRDSCKPLEAEQ